MNMLTKPLSKVLCFSLFLVNPLYAALIDTELIHLFPTHLKIPPKMPLEFETHFKILSIASQRIDLLNIPTSNNPIDYSYQGFLELYLLYLFKEDSLHSKIYTPDLPGLDLDLDLALKGLIKNFKNLPHHKRFTLAAFYYANHLEFFLKEFSESFRDNKDFWKFCVETLKKDAQNIWDNLTLEHAATLHNGSIKEVRKDLESYVEALYSIQNIIRLMQPSI